MYNPASFREDRIEVLREMIATHPLATLVTAGPAGIEATHLPLIYVSSGGSDFLRGHVARANPHWKQPPPDGQALAIFTGLQHYITPGWYPAKQQHGQVVPTWNYTAVHVRGKLAFHHDPAWLWEMAEALTAAQEAALGTSWKVTDAPREYIDAQMSAIVGVELAIHSIEGKWKLSQNRNEADREGVVAGLEALGTAPACGLAALMRRRRERS